MRRQNTTLGIALLSLGTIIAGATAVAAQDTITQDATAQDVTAQDVVTIVGPTGRRTRLVGRVVAYNGRELRLVRRGGRTQSVPAEQVVAVMPHYGRNHELANARFAARQYAEALPLYRLARTDATDRAWVRRLITAEIVRCLAALGRVDEAGEEFLILIQSDPQTPYLDCIPLTWLARQPSIALDRAARRWIGRQEPTAVLLGASHLLTSRDRSSALARLQQLIATPDRRIAQLALAQTWRTQTVTVTDAKIDAWRLAIEQMPDALTAGPYYTLGRALARRQQWERAALAMLHVPLLHSNQHALAAQSLNDAGRALEQLGRTNEALRLYRELLRDYATTRAVPEAESRIEAITHQP